jgi:hypothetical protein
VKIVAWLVAAGALCAADLPKAESILEQYVAATGGRAAYEKRTSEYFKGTVAMPAANLSGTYESWSAAPNSRVDIINIPGAGKIEQGTNGKDAWELSAFMGPRLKNGLERTDALREALFNFPIYWAKLYSKVETVGVETVEGVPCYKIVATPTEGKPETWFFDQKKSLTVKMIRTATTSMGEITAEVIMKDYKPLGGILQPALTIQRTSGQEMTITIEEVKSNLEVPPAKFEPPAEIKALMNRKKSN